MKLRTATWLTVYLDEAGVCTDDIVNNRKAETGPLAWLLSSKIRFKNAAADVRFHTNAGICDADVYVSFCFGFGETLTQDGTQGRSSLQKNFPAVWHRVPRVHADIEYGLIDETGIDHDHRRARIQICGDFNCRRKHRGQ